MVTLRFPSLNKALIKNQKDLKEDDPRKGIIVLENNAIVLRNDFCFVINLYDYFTLECDIEHEEEIEELNRILFYMNGKIFSDEFWTELTKGSNTKMHNGNIYIENPKYSKDLYYKEIKADLLEPLLSLQSANIQEENLISCIGLPFSVLNTIYNCMSSDFKTDILLLEFTDQERAVKFTFRARKHCYGYICPHYDSTQEGFRFETFNNFIQSDTIVKMIEDLRKNIAPPPPVSDSQQVADEMVKDAKDEDSDLFNQKQE